MRTRWISFIAWIHSIQTKIAALSKHTQKKKNKNKRAARMPRIYSKVNNFNVLLRIGSPFGFALCMRLNMLARSLAQFKTNTSNVACEMPLPLSFVCRRWLRLIRIQFGKVSSVNVWHLWNYRVSLSQLFNSVEKDYLCFFFKPIYAFQAIIVHFICVTHHCFTHRFSEWEREEEKKKKKRTIFSPDNLAIDLKWPNEKKRNFIRVLNLLNTHQYKKKWQPVPEHQIVICRKLHQMQHQHRDTGPRVQLVILVFRRNWSCNRWTIDWPDTLIGCDSLKQKTIVSPSKWKLSVKRSLVNQRTSNR